MSTQIALEQQSVGAGAAIVPMVLLEGPRAGRPVRRSFTREYKQRIVAEYDSAPKGEKGAIIRRERIWDTHIRRWRKEIVNEGHIEMTRRGRPSYSDDQRRVRELEKENDALRATIAKRDDELERTSAALEVLGKGVAFLEALSSKNAG